MRAVALALFAALALSAPVNAAVKNDYVVKFEKPFERADANVVAASVVWSCAGDTCTGELPRRAPVVRDCMRVAQELGRVTEFGTNDQKLTDEQLTQCNTRAKG
jgi:hypothetical protein